MLSLEREIRGLEERGKRGGGKRETRKKGRTGINKGTDFTWFDRFLEGRRVPVIL